MIAGPSRLLQPHSADWDGWKSQRDNPRVLFVCTGNINRSAAAAIMANSPSLFWEVRSAALRGPDGRRMSPKMRALMAGLGQRERVEAEEHRSTHITPELLVWADCVVGFQPSHSSELSNLDLRPWANFSHYTTMVNHRVPDPNFDSSGETHLLVVRALQDGLPRLYEDIARRRP